MRVFDLIVGATGQIVGAPVNAVSNIINNDRTFQVAGGVSSGTGAAVVDIQVSNNGIDFMTIGSVSIDLGTSRTSAGFSQNAPWAFIRAAVVSISGTGANVSVNMGAM